MRLAGTSQAHIGEGPNEDAFGWNTSKSLAFVADGIGGSAKGEIASGLVKEVFERAEAGTDLKQLALTAHARILEAAADKPESKGMGCTLVAVEVVANEAHVVWVGDSRAYLWRNDKLKPLTKDHSLAEIARDEEGLTETQVRRHPGHNMILQALGRDTPAPSGTTIRLRDKDRLLLCSDGVSGRMLDHEIAQVLRSETMLESLPPLLVAAAVAAGSKDDVSVVLAEYEGTGTRRYWPIMIVVAGLSAVAIAAAFYWLIHK
jgi:PPM family protein phosphatase